MSLIRSFTARLGKPDELPKVHIGRAASQRAGKPVQRSQISSPVALISSSNPLSRNAPDIAGTTPIRYRDTPASSASSRHSAEDSDTSTMTMDSHTDASSVDDSSPITPEPEPNHLSCYFKPAIDTRSGTTSPCESARTSFDAPTIPTRVPSHSKRAHENLHRKRSVQRLMSPPTSMVGRNSSDLFKPVDTPRENPFGNELAQLDEIAEDLSLAVRDAEAEADAERMQSRNLAHFAASDYLFEIQALIYETFHVEQPSWI